MNPALRQKYLKIGVAVVAGLFLADRVVLTPLTNRWKDQGEQIDKLREEVKRGRALLGREQALRDRWTEMLRTDLPEDNSAAIESIWSSIGKWAAESRVSLKNVTPGGWRPNDDYETCEFRLAAQGDQASLSRLIYQLETDPLPVRLEECEYSTADKSGRQLTLTMRFSAVRLASTLR